MYGTNRINKQGHAAGEMSRKATLFTRALCWPLSLVFLIIGGGGCALFSKKQEQVAPIIVLPIFPPQEVMRNGDYTGFLRGSQANWAECKDDDQCAIAIFSIAFVYAYPSSPYYNLKLGLYYFDELIQKYPQTPWGLQAKVWSDFMKKSIASEKSRYRLKNTIKYKDTTIKDLHKQIEQFEENEANMKEHEKKIEQPKEVDPVTDKREKELEKLIEKSRQIDIEIDRKERELLR